MKRKWTRTDEDRARKMGWYLRRGWMAELAYLNFRIVAYRSEEQGAPLPRFKSDHEATEWVMEQCARHPIPRDDCFEDVKVCRKAVLSCCLGGDS